MTNTKLIIAAVVPVILVVAFSLLPAKPHSEEALLTDWSDPPPWPIFIAVNALATSLRSIADALTPPPVRMLDMAASYQTSILADVCQRFKIPDFLGTGPKTIPQLAKYLETDDTSRVERLMFAMASDGITKLDPSIGDGEEPRFVNSDLSATLRRDHPNSVAGMVGHWIQDNLQAFTKISDLLGPESKDNLWFEVYPEYAFEGGLWKFYEDNPEREEQFTRAMFSLEGLGGKAMAKDAPFHKFNRIIDIGGSLGHFLHKVMNVNPKIKGVLFDRPEVIKYAKEYWFSESGIYHDGTEKRVEFIEGSFFDADALPEAQDGDVYHMRYILHDWGHAECIKILKNIKSKMKGKKATLMIGESAMPDRHTVGTPATVHKIDMLMLTFFHHAVERTPHQFKQLLDEAGFELVDFHATRSLIHFVEAVPKPE